MPPHTVFVYGILKTPEHFADPPESVPGVLYVAGGYGAARFGPGPDVVRGELRQVDDATLREWDELEDVAGGLYRRVRVTTRSGVEAWAYEYARAVDGLPRLRDGLWLA